MACAAHGCSERHRIVEASSQRYPLSRPVELALGVFGGNGSGKSEFAAQLACAVAIGRDDPDVQLWVEQNGVEPSLVPPKGGLVVVSSLSSNLSKLTMRPKVGQYMPPGSVWRNRDGAGVAEIEPSRRCGNGKVVFMSNDQGKDKFQGFAASLIVLDEEHDRGVYDECLQRLSRARWEGRSGYIVLTMTPLKGLTWVHSEFVDPELKAPYARACWLWGENNPHLDQPAREQAIASKSISESMRAARDRGAFGNAEGLIYRTWRRDIHVIKPFHIDFNVMREGWFAVESIDFGDRNPFSYGLYAYDIADDRLYRIAEHHKAEMPLSQHVAAIREIRQRFRVDADTVITVADPAQAGQRRSMAFDHEMPTIAATKDVQAGIEACQERLRWADEKELGFFVFDTCPKFIREVEGYRWLERKIKADQPEQPLKKDDHAMDEWRYCVMAVNRGICW